MKKVEIQKDQYKKQFNSVKEENDTNTTLIETLLHSESEDVVDVRLVGQVYDLYKEKCKKLEEANARIDSFDKITFDETKVNQASPKTSSNEIVTQNEDNFPCSACTKTCSTESR